MTDKPRPRWFRFSLRTLFIVVTLLCCWLGWEISVVRHRQAVRKDYQTRFGLSFTTAGDYASRFPPGTPVPKLAKVSYVRRLLGDQPIQEITIAHFQSPADAEMKGLASVFPEAQFRQEHIPLEPCHPGCFPRGTLVETPTGPKPIETLQPGDSLTIVGSNGERITSSIQSIFVTTNRLWLIDTEAGSLITTEKQPLCRPDVEPIAAGDLQAGDQILHWHDGELQTVSVISVTETDRQEQVFNLVVGNSEFFIAGRFLARSKPPAETPAIELAGE